MKQTELHPVVRIQLYTDDKCFGPGIAQLLELVAERMHTHRNTIKYRLHRLQELTGLDLKNPKDNFKLYLAVLARKLHSAQRNCQNGQKNEEKV